MEPLDLTPDMLLRAYAIGVFPMAEDRDDPDLFWIDPRMRGVIPLDGFHIPKRLRKTLRSNRYRVTFDRDFEGVMDGCAEATDRRPRTWINDKILTLYTALFRMNHAHSVEVWDNGRLIGGLYGVTLGGAYFGESMFSRERDASKIALCHLVARLTFAGYRLLDTQFVTKHLQNFGAQEVPRSDYRARLSEALNHDVDFFTSYSDGEMLRYLDSMD
ncbi:leucyl/phenylalanyl-tRNA--protein transferase [Rhodospirillaceae bacterium KN72]|uniref:Leucyl/phenylalanyl-tRNA--protein transferase n=1 Tax=Pacificispira spongiicola TaxID=2729598 RepID=A0A7Y0DZA3_9PROT|nr:leucyl/phenylalanyl-tRNA--protein transferase [Pacificispira spongiicola]NMM44325.1 leucyl/phenylalanyl-tRNA--protein transferase [Pacificispira spongiicola]